MKALNLIGEKYGKLTVLSKAENIGKRTAWLCECECYDENNKHRTVIERIDNSTVDLDLQLDCKWRSAGPVGGSPGRHRKGAGGGQRRTMVRSSAAVEIRPRSAPQWQAPIFPPE